MTSNVVVFFQGVSAMGACAAAETRPCIYALRLPAFVPIIVATIEKNRSRRP